MGSHGGLNGDIEPERAHSSHGAWGHVQWRMPMGCGEEGGGVKRIGCEVEQVQHVHSPTDLGIILGFDLSMVVEDVDSEA